MKDASSSVLPVALPGDTIGGHNNCSLEHNTARIEMAYTADAIANEFLDTAWGGGEHPTPMQIQNLGLRRIRSRRQLWEWKTNEVPGTGHMAAMGGPDELVQDLEAAGPYLMKIATHLISRDLGEGLPLGTLGFYLLSNWIHEQNVPDSKILVQMSGHKLGVYNDNFRLDLKIETTKAIESNGQGGPGHES